MTSGLIKDPGAVDHRPALGVGGAEDHPSDAGQADGAGAHGAGLQGHGQGEVHQAVIADRLGRVAKGDDLGMGGGIAAVNRGVGAATQHLARGRIIHHRAHGNLAGLGGGLRQFQGKAHHGVIMNDHNSHRNGPKAPGQGARQASAPAVPEGERVAKALARAGVASRREIERLIEAGRVALNGQVLTTPAVKVGPADILTVDGAPVEAAEPARLFLYHKPPGLVTTHADPKGRPTVFQALPKGLPRLISVGRLDLNSEGLLLLTNDGGLSRALELPSTGLARCYRARARGRITQARLDALKDGIVVEGVQYGAIDATLDKAKEGPAGANLWITLTLTEGKNREVRRVLEALGLSVNRLIRIAYGPFALGALERGAVEEVGPRALREQLGHLIAPGHQPRGDRPLYRPEPTAAQAPTRRPKGVAIGRVYSPKPPRDKPRPARGAATQTPPSGRGEKSGQGEKRFASRPPKADGKSTKAAPPRDRAAGQRPPGPKGSGPKASGARPAGARPSGARPSDSRPSGAKPRRPGAGRKGPAS